MYHGIAVKRSARTQYRYLKDCVELLGPSRHDNSAVHDLTLCPQNNRNHKKKKAEIASLACWLTNATRHTSIALSSTVSDSPRCAAGPCCEASRTARHAFNASKDRGIGMSVTDLFSSRMSASSPLCWANSIGTSIASPRQRNDTVSPTNESVTSSLFCVRHRVLGLMMTFSNSSVTNVLPAATAATNTVDARIYLTI